MEGDAVWAVGGRKAPIALPVPSLLVMAVGEQGQGGGLGER